MFCLRTYKMTFSVTAIAVPILSPSNSRLPKPCPLPKCNLFHIVAPCDGMARDFE